MSNMQELAKLPEEDEGVSQPILPRTDVPPSGRRPALRDVRRQLTNEELASPGVQKLLLDMLEESDVEKEDLKPYVQRFYEADKRASILVERLNADRAMEVYFGAGLGLGGAVLALAPHFWSLSVSHGVICIVIGLALIVGTSVGRIIKR